MKTRNYYIPVLFLEAILLNLLIFFGLSVSAEVPLTLKDCLNLALQNSRSTKMADLSIEAAREKVAEVNTQRLPSLSLLGTYTHVGKVTSFTIPMGTTPRTFQFGTPNRTNLDARIQWPLYTGGRLNASMAISKLGEDLSINQRRAAAVQTIYQVLQAYYSVLLNEKIIQLQSENLQREENLWQITQRRYAAGGIPKLEVLRAEVQVKNDAAILEETRGNLKKSELFLRKTLGNPAYEFRIIGQLQYVPVSIVLDNLIQRALEVRTDYQSIQLQQKLSHQQLKLVSSSNKPNLSFFSGYNVQNGFDPTDPERFVSNWNAGVQLSIPLFDGFSTRYKQNQAIIDIQKTNLQKEELQDAITLQIEQAVTTLNQAALKIESQEKNIELAREALRVTTEQFEQGIVSSLDVLDAQQTLARSEMMYIQALFNHIMAKIEISRAIEDFSWFEPDLLSSTPINE